MKNYLSTFVILTYLGFYPSLSLADDLNGKEQEASLTRTFGKEKVEAFYKYIEAYAMGKQPVSELDKEYQPRLDRLTQQKLNLNRSNYGYEDSKKKIREEYSRVLAEKDEKYKQLVDYNFIYTIKILGDKKLIEKYRKDVPNIDKIHQSLEIYTCAEIVEALELKTNIGVVYNEMKGSNYRTLGFNNLEKNLLSSNNQDRSFEYTSLIIQSEITPTMPVYLFVDALEQYRNMIKEYAKFKNDPNVMTILKKYSNSMCLPYAKYVGGERI